MAPMTTTAAALVATMMIMAGCSSAESDTDIAPTSTTSSDATAGPDGTDDTSSTTAPTTAPPPPVIDGLAPVVLLTPASGGGPRPLLEWERVVEAASYLVVVYDGDGDAFWSAITDATSVYLGGPELIPEANSAPRLAGDSTWVVFARDATGRVIAASGRAPIAP
jgi:hypothetical protein